MSTSLYLYCEGHDPHLSSGDLDLVLSDLQMLRGKVQDRTPIINSINRYFLDKNDWDFTRLEWYIYAHQSCVLRIQDKYGRVYPVDGPRDCDHHCTPNQWNTKLDEKHYLDCPVWEFVKEKL